MKYPYWLVLLLGLDRFGAAVFFNRPDITISSLCWIVRYALQDDVIAIQALSTLKLYKWQHWILLKLSSVLEWIQPGHCFGARATDIETAQSVLNLLLTPPPVPSPVPTVTPTVTP